jgi:hypothetical protein
MPRGRPVRSQIRQNMIELISVMGHGYGYEIHKRYIQIFPTCTREVIYYHLRKGVALGEFAIDSVRQEKGEYSWGTTVEKTYYKLGPNAKLHGDSRVKEYFERQK